MRGYTSNSHNVCGVCGGSASRKYPDTEMFSRCDECRAELSRTGSFGAPDRYSWTPARQAERQRSALRAMLDDADRNYFGPEGLE